MRLFQKNQERPLCIFLKIEKMSHPDTRLDSGKLKFGWMVKNAGAGD